MAELIPKELRGAQIRVLAHAPRPAYHIEK